MKHLREFALFFALQSLAYAAMCWNFRAIAQARYGHIFVSDRLCATLGFTLVKRVADAKGKVAMAGYVLGGAAGSLFSVWLTTHVFGR